MRKLVFLLIALFGSLSLSLLLAEGFLRLFPGFLPPERRQFMQVDLGNVGVEHPYIGHLQTPNAAKRLSGPDFDVVQRTGPFGFRNSGPWPSQADVVVLGDSLVFGYGVSEDSAWPAILDRSFPNLQVVNLGLVGAGAEQYFRVFQTFGQPLHPKLVIIGMFPGNDFWDAGQFDTWLRQGAHGNYMVWRNYGRFSGSFFDNPKKGLVSLLIRYSYLYNLVAAARAGRSADGDSDSKSKVLHLQDGHEMRLALADFDSRTRNGRPGRREFDLTVKALTKIRDSVRNEGAHLLVVLQPSKEEVYSPSPGVKPRDASGSLRTALTRLGIEYLDLTPTFTGHASGPPLFFEADGHPNERGYRLIADAVAAYLDSSLHRRNNDLHGLTRTGAALQEPPDKPASMATQSGGSE